MKKNILILLLLFSCSGIREENKPNPEPVIRHDVELIMKIALSYEYDFEKEICTVYFWDKPPMIIPFKLTEEEKEQINKMYYDLKLYELPIQSEIQDICLTMPKIYTTLNIKRGKELQEIKIDNSCKEFSMEEQTQAKKVKEFITYAYQILNSKPEILNSPKSDMIYK